MLSAEKDKQTRKPTTRGRPGFDRVDRAAADIFREIAATSPLSRSGGTPLWVQLKIRIEEAIRTGKLAENARLPSEQAICSMFGLSRPVIRSALAALTTQRLVVKQARRGMYVAPKPRDFGFVTAAIPLVSDLSARGYEVSEKTYEFALHPANTDELRALNLENGSSVLRILRVFYADGVPLTHTEISLPAHRLPGMESMDLRGRSILETIKQVYGLAVQRADRWIHASVVDADPAARMNVEVGTPMLRLHSVAYDHDGVPLEYYSAFYNTDVAPIHIATDGMNTADILADI